MGQAKRSRLLRALEYGNPLSMQSAVAIARINILVALVVLALKALAAWWSGSVALFSDAVESIVNVATACAALFAIWYAARPPDWNHPYGHEKAEYFVALFEAVLIGAAGWAIVTQAAEAFLAPRALAVPAEAYAANIGAGLINGAWCFLLIRRGRAMASTALEADGWHLFADVLSSAGVLAGIFLAQLTGLFWLDPALAMLVAVNIFWSGLRLLRMSLGGLMDAAPKPELVEAIRRAIAGAGEGALQAHDLKSRVSGPTTFIEFHLIVPGNRTVAGAHAICDRIEAEIRRQVPGARISIHVEPEEKAHAHGGIKI
jgi:cation diffusion facilitator family transporter